VILDLKVLKFTVIELNNLEWGAAAAQVLKK
jgi:hypothetical protein